MDIKDEEIRAFEDFQRHARQERRDYQYETARKQLRENVLAFATKPGSAYRRTVDTVTGEKSIEPNFTMADHDLLRAMQISA